jgi:hypothetical protein
LTGHKLHVECSSWPNEFAEKTWGPKFSFQTTEGEIRQVRQSRSTHLPKFHIHFKDTKTTYVDLDLDYVMKYTIQFPETLSKYNTLKAEYIIRKAREASEKPRSTKRTNNDDASAISDAINDENDIVHPEKQAIAFTAHKKKMWGKPSSRDRASKEKKLRCFGSETVWQ